MVEHFSKPDTFSTFQQYVENAVVQYICAKLNNLNCVDIVWDQYFNNSLKNTTRAKHGRGVRRKVSPQTAIPCNWKDFLHNSKTKIELPDFPYYKAKHHSSVAVAWTNSKNICTHKEADTRLIIYLLQAAEKGMKNIII